MKPAPVLLAFLLTAGLTAPTAAAAPAASGTFSVLTYNVAGLPLGLSSGDPAANTPEIGRRISAYDVVHVQEDFNFHAALHAADTHPHRTPTSGGVPFGDGLNTLSALPYSDLVRDRWDRCNGTDCLTPKGFTFSRVRLAEGVYVDFYNLHPNAGSAEADLAARRANISELSTFIGAFSAGNAVVVAGDTNTRWTRAADNIRDLVGTHGLTDAWVEEERGGVPPAVGAPGLVCDDAAVTDACEVVDKILYRGNRYIDLSLERYSNENAAFRTADDRMLSDHYPIAADLRWTLATGLTLSDVVGGRVTGTRDGTPENERRALDALAFLREQVRRRRVPDALVLPNHPCRLGINSPHETRAWRDAAPELVVGMEGAPGHQAAGLPAPGMARARGLYDSAPGRFSFPGYPAEAYRTWGGFDWMAATVGGVWDSMLAEGRPWWITATSDGHQGCGDWVKNPVDPLDQTGYDAIPYDEQGNTFASTGRFPDPVNAGRPVTEYSSFPPGAYSRTWVGATRFGHTEVLEAIRAGRMWVCFGDLVAGLDVRLRKGGRDAGMGETLATRSGETVEVAVRVDLTEEVNYAGLMPVLARVDLVLGDVTGPAADPDTVRAPGTRVVRSWEVTQRSGRVELVHEHTVTGPFSVRVRGTDGKRQAVGFHGADVDPSGPAMDEPGRADPWEDLWFYSNPVFATTRR